eukprot:Skav209095  [mRNA]  locus=scaffold207:1058767:1059066:+ [translate_table: standard]
MRVVSEFQNLCGHLCPSFSCTSAHIEDTFLEVGGILVPQVLVANGSSLCLCLALKILLTMRATPKLLPSFLRLKFLVFFGSSLQH